MQDIFRKSHLESGDGSTTLAESRQYRITNEFETVFLEDKINHTRTMIGEFYGDPEGAFIDRNERFAVVYGCSLLVHPLDLSCRAIRKEFTSGQNEEILWIAHAVLTDDDYIRIMMESGEMFAISPFSDVDRL